MTSTVTFDFSPRTIFEGRAFTAVVECFAEAAGVTYVAAREYGFPTRNAAYKAAQALCARKRRIEAQRRVSFPCNSTNH